MAVLRSKGVTLKQGSTAIAQVKSITMPSITVDTAEIHELGDSWKEFLPTINDPGEISAVLYWDYDDATHTSAYGLLASQLSTSTPTSWVITLTDATPSTITQSGWLTALSPETMEVGGVITCAITIKCSGAPVVA